MKSNISSSSTRLRLGGVLAATSLIVLGGFGVPASAQTGQSEALRSEQTAGARSDPTANGGDPITEDTDTNDGPTANNVVDSGDNQHPSGNDRSVENGGSGDQGNTMSEPDGNGSGPERDNRGVDQPGNPGGADLADQDANNGCGNDDDFEDDNEGLCGPRKSSPTTPTDSPPSTPPVGVETGATPEAVRGAEVQNNPTGPTGSNNPTGPTGSNTPGDTTASNNQTGTIRVLGVSIERPADATALNNPSVPTRVLGVSIERPAIAAAAIASPTAAPGATEVGGATLPRTGFGTTTLVLVALSLLLVGGAMVRRPKGARLSA